MPVIPIADWVPDAAALGNPGAIRVENALPAPTGFKPFPRLTTVSDALDARPRGAISAIDNSLNTYLYAGDAAKLYSLTGTAWGDVSLSGGYSTGTEEVWDFVRWKNKVLATNFSDNPQQIALAAANFSNLTTDFRARRIATVREFVVFGNTTDSTDGARIDRVRWSAANDETDYTVSSTTGADVRDLNAGGQIQKIVGGEFGVIISERSTWRMSFTGAPTWFQIDEVLPGVGAISPGSVARLGNEVYFLSENGFVALLNGTQARFVGTGRVDRTVLADLDENNAFRMSAVADPSGNRIAWAYPGAGAVDGRPNKVIIYDRGLDRWSQAILDVELLWRAAGVGTTVEELDDFSASLDDLGASLDSSQWKGDAPEFAAFNAAFKHGFFTGSPQTAVFETRETEVHAGYRTTLLALRALVDGGSLTAKVGTRGKSTDEIAWTNTLTQRSGGRIPCRASGRYHRVQLTVSGEWKDVSGVEIDPADARRSGRRG